VDLPDQSDLLNHPNHPNHLSLPDLLDLPDLGVLRNLLVQLVLSDQRQLNQHQQVLLVL
jgi:hypothetical protein